MATFCVEIADDAVERVITAMCANCLLYTSPSPRD